VAVFSFPRCVERATAPDRLDPMEMWPSATGRKRPAVDDGL